ncbi:MULTISPECIES: AMP-binding protein [unclassified Pseudonocardia]|uniref:AMP-binding protein n=1 Tax=unclassified Pseudonocardia TaxID=2619320 RepID=UPI000AF80096|nr:MULTISPECIES: AMP-binding protein [unclassified Pseudonocardia]MBN9097885.1 AMP-binding protein [Pseudonocardia sp.]
MTSTPVQETSAPTQDGQGPVGAPSYAYRLPASPLLGATIGEHFDQVSDRFPDNEAVVALPQQRRLRYRELRAEVDALAKGMLARRIERGDRVGMWATNCWEWVALQFATAKVGAILVTVNPSYRVLELEYALNQSGVRMLVTSRGTRYADYLAMLGEIAPELESTAPGRLESARLPHLRDVVVLGEEAAPGTITFAELAAAGAATDDGALAARGRSLQFDDPINIQYTSGTTGSPKGVVLTHHNLLNNGYQHGLETQRTHLDRVVAHMPFYHTGGMSCTTMATVSHGATLIIPSETFDPVAVLQAVHDERATVLNGVPTMFVALLSVPDLDRFDLTSLRTGFMGGAPCPIEIVRRVMTDLHVPDFVIMFGQTESSPIIVGTTIDDPEEVRASTVGRPYPHVEIKVVDPATGDVVPRGVQGEVCARGYPVMRGYWENPEGTAEALDEAHWLHTGDLGEMDGDGFMKITGRKKDMIIRGGENIYPAEIEGLLYGFDPVEEVQVTGVPDEKYGEEVVAFVKLRDGATCTEDELKDFCRARVAHFKSPRFVLFVDEFPMTVTGKIQKYRLRDIAIERLGRQQAAAIATA